MNERYATLDRLLAQQSTIEARLARRHLGEGTLALDDVTRPIWKAAAVRSRSSATAATASPTTADRLWCAVHAAGLPDRGRGVCRQHRRPGTLKDRSKSCDSALACGAVLSADLPRDDHPGAHQPGAAAAGLDWITALRAPQIQALAAADRPLQLSLFDERDLAEITSPDYPGERLIVCRNPALAEERSRKRGEPLAATEPALRAIQTRVRRKRRPLRGAAAIGEAVGALLNRKKMAKHFTRTITDEDFTFTRNHATIAAEAKLDGV